MEKQVEETNKWNIAVTSQVVKKNNFGITKIQDFISLKNLYFDNASYTDILNLLKANNLLAIKNIEEPLKKGFREYLHIITFIDQQQRKFALTVYDSDELWQDPEIIDIIPLSDTNASVSSL